MRGEEGSNAIGVFMRTPPELICELAWPNYTKQHLLSAFVPITWVPLHESFFLNSMRSNAKFVTAFINWTP